MSSSESIRLRIVQRLAAVHLQQIEEERRERQLAPERVHVEAPAEAAHRFLERHRRAVGAKREHLAVENQRLGGQRAHGVDDFRHGGGDLVQCARIDLHEIAGLVDLHPRTVQLVLDRRVAQRPDGCRDVVGRVGEHRLDGREQLDAKAIEAGLAGGERRLGDD